jgi:hypothetical protein
VKKQNTNTHPKNKRGERGGGKEGLDRGGKKGGGVERHKYIQVYGL